MLTGKSPASHLVHIHVSSIAALSIFPECFIQDRKYHIRRDLIFRRICVRFIEDTHAIISEHLETSEKGGMSIKASASTKTRNSDNRHLQACIFAQEPKGKRI